MFENKFYVTAQLLPNIVVGNPDQDPKPYVGYPRGGGWVFMDLSDVSPLWVSKTGKCGSMDFIERCGHIPSFNGYLSDS